MVKVGDCAITVAFGITNLNIVFTKSVVKVDITSIAIILELDVADVVFIRNMDKIVFTTVVGVNSVAGAAILDEKSTIADVFIGMDIAGGGCWVMSYSSEIMTGMRKSGWNL